MKRWIAIAAVLAMAACERTPVAQNLDRFNTVPAFKLTAETGQPFDSTQELAGKVWIADFIYTTCPGPCPLMSTWMASIQRKLADVPDIRLVSFTVNPAVDTPEVLADYAKRYRAQPGRWFFLTGPRETLNDLNRNAFQLGNVDGSLTHSTRFVLVDRTGTVRGYYLSSEHEKMQQLVADAHRLATEG